MVPLKIVHGDQEINLRATTEDFIEYKFILVENSCYGLSLNYWRIGMANVLILIVGGVAILLATIAYDSYAVGIGTGLVSMVCMHYITSI